MFLNKENTIIADFDVVTLKRNDAHFYQFKNFLDFLVSRKCLSLSTESESKLVYTNLTDISEKDSNLYFKGLSFLEIIGSINSGSSYFCPQVVKGRLH